MTQARPQQAALTRDNDPTKREETRRVIEAMVDGLNDHQINGMAAFFHPAFRWMGNCGCGVKNGLREFQENWQRPFQAAFSDKVAIDEARIFDGQWGACFGAQVLGRSLGGHVTENRDGHFIFGSEQITLGPAFHDAWFAPLAAAPRPALRLLTSHGEHVAELPPSAQLLAHSARTPHEIFVVGQKQLGVQCHAELVLDDLLGIILPRLRERSRLSKAQEEAALASLAHPVDSDWMMALFRRFLDGPPDRSDRSELAELPK